MSESRKVTLSDHERLTFGQRAPYSDENGSTVAKPVLAFGPSFQRLEIAFILVNLVS